MWIIYTMGRSNYILFTAVRSTQRDAGYVERMSTVALQSLADARQDPFLIVDDDFKIVAVNRVFERTYGTSRERIVGCPRHAVSR